jgi:hypothetical protein
MGNLVFLNLVVMHLLGCVWFYLIAMSEEWIQNMDFIFGYGIKYQMYWYQNWFHQYLSALYTSFYLFGVGEVVPQTVNETIMAILILIVLTIINNAIIGLFSMYSDELSAKANEL